MTIRRALSSYFATAPLLLLLGFGLLLPIARVIPLSFMHWNETRNAFEPPPTLDSYLDFLHPHRGGIVLRCLLMSLAVATVVSIIAVPVAIGLRMSPKYRFWIGLFEGLLALPFLFSPALRLHSLKVLLGQQGPVVAILRPLTPDGTANEWLLYSSFSVVVALAFSYAALLILPLFQLLKSIDDTLLWTARDLGMTSLGTSRLLFRFALPGFGAGLCLLVAVSWFSSLEYEILGKQPSVLNMLDGLVGVEKYPQAFAFALFGTLLTTGALLYVVLFCKPERLIGMESARDAGV